MYYFDFAATTPVDKKVFDEMKKYFFDEFGNSFSLHKFGQNALRVIDLSREKIKNILEANSEREIIFTSSATESNNLIIKGAALNCFFKNNSKPRIISTTIEHSSILETLRYLEKLNIAEIDLIKPEQTGVINFQKILNAIQKNTILISIHYINSETGVIQPIKTISTQLKKISSQIIFHTDASQFLTEDISVKNLGVDAMTLSGHKIYGPKGTSLLYKNENIKILPLISGANQEFGLRAGTENIAGIAGIAKAIEIVKNESQKINQHLIETRDYFLKKLNELKIDFEINAPIELSSPKIVSLYFPKIDSRDLLIYLSENNIFVSAGSACLSRAATPSPVIEEMYPNSDRSKKTARFSFGKNSTKEEIDYLAKKIKLYEKHSILIPICDI